MSDIRLPIKKNPPYKSFQESAFYLGILLTDPKYINEFFNSYINFAISTNGWFRACTPKYNWYDYSECDCEIESIIIKGNPYNISKGDPYESLVKLMQKKIASGYFVQGFCDEFYIPSKFNYNKNHNFHDYLLYGHNNEEKYFIALGYTDNWKYEEYKISYSEMYDSIKWTKENNICALNNGVAKYEFIKPKAGKRYLFDIKKVKEELYNFLTSQDSIDRTNIYGINACSIFCETLKEKFDIRSLRVVMEHSSIMADRIEYISNNLGIQLDDIICRYSKVKNNSKIMFYTALKYLITNREYLKEKVEKMVREIFDEEIPILKDFYDRI